MSDWYIKKMESSDEEQYLNFLGHRITKLPVAEHYRWLYCRNPHGRALTWLVIHRPTGNIIGSTAIFPRYFWVQGRKTLGGVGGDTLVNPRFRRQGMATELHRFSIPSMMETGVHFHYGFPNRGNLGAFRKAGACFPGVLRGIELPITRGENLQKKLALGLRDPLRLARLTGKLFQFYNNRGIARSHDFERNFKQVSGFDGRFDMLAAELNSLASIYGVRDSSYLNWRYFDNPARAHTVFSYEERGELQGFAVLEFSATVCYLVDFFVKPDDVLAENLLNGVIALAYANGSRRIKSLINPGGAFFNTFMRRGFTFNVDEVPLQILIPAADGPLASLLDLEEWYLSYAEYDVEAVSFIAESA
jgi:hypothetical protein